MNETAKLGNLKLKREVIELFVLSFASLYLELLVIRWMAADIRAFSVFRTFPLVTCFVGLGVGCSKGTDKLFRSLPLALLLFAAIMKAPDVFGLWQWLPFPSDAVSVEFNTAKDLGARFWSYMLFFIPFLVLVLAGPFGVMVT